MEDILNFKLEKETKDNDFLVNLYVIMSILITIAGIWLGGISLLYGLIIIGLGIGYFIIALYIDIRNNQLKYLLKIVKIGAKLSKLKNK